MIIEMRVHSAKRYTPQSGRSATILTLVDCSKGLRCITPVEFYASDERHGQKGDLSAWQDEVVIAAIEEIESKNGKISFRGDVMLKSATTVSNNRQAEAAPKEKAKEATATTNGK